MRDNKNYYEERPWGSFEVFDEGGIYKVKKIIVYPEHKLSLQSHLHRSEHWVVIKGTATITKNNDVFILPEGEYTFIPMNSKHRIANEGKINLEIVEVQIGSYLGEDDIFRFEDEYDRN